MKAQALDNGTVVTTTKHGSVAIMEAHTELENGSVMAAQSIWLSTASAKTLRDFLNEEFPTPEAEKYKAVIGAMELIASDPYAPNVASIAMKALGWED